MPDALYMGEIAIGLAMKEGKVNLSTVEESVRRILTPMFRFGVFDIQNNNSRAANVTSQAHVRRVARASLTVNGLHVR